MLLNTFSGPVAAYLLSNPPTPDDTACQRWIIAEHFPEQECSVVLSPTLPLDIPEELTDHLRVAQTKLPQGSIFMVVRPLKP